MTDPKRTDRVCGLSGYDGMKDPPCPGCEEREKGWRMKPTEQPCEMFLCEIAHLILHEGQLYRFYKHPDCKECREYGGKH